MCLRNEEVKPQRFNVCGIQGKDSLRSWGNLETKAVTSHLCVPFNIHQWILSLFPKFKKKNQNIFCLKTIKRLEGVWRKQVQKDGNNYISQKEEGNEGRVLRWNMDDRRVYDLRRGYSRLTLVAVALLAFTVSGSASPQEKRASLKNTDTSRRQLHSAGLNDAG